MSDLVERLRAKRCWDLARGKEANGHYIEEEAADELERLRGLLDAVYVLSGKRGPSIGDEQRCVSGMHNWRGPPKGTMECTECGLKMG